MTDDAPIRCRDSPFEDYASYQDGDALVVTDRSNPNAWIRSDVTVSLDPDDAETEPRPSPPR